MTSSQNKIQAKRLQQQINQRLKNLAAQRSVPVRPLRYQLVFEVFLRRLFTNAPELWTLCGGSALLMRNGQGRFTQDLDLARKFPWKSPKEVELELEKAVSAPSSDPFTFRIKNVETKRDADPIGYFGPSLRATVTAFMGVNVFEDFSIDVISHRHTQAPTEAIRVEPMINEFPEYFEAPFVLFTTSAESHLSDKICALYEPHPNGISTRYHDLADIITIISTLEYSAQRLKETLNHEANRRHVEVPFPLVSPGSEFTQGYERIVPTYLVIPDEFHTMDASLEFVNECLGPVLAGEVNNRMWNPNLQAWVSTTNH